MEDDIGKSPFYNRRYIFKTRVVFSSQSFVRFSGGFSSSCSHARATGWRKGLLHRVLILQLLQDLQRKRSSKLSGVQVPLHHRKKDERRVHLRIDPRKKKEENPSEPNKIIFRFRFVKIFGTRFLVFLQKWCWGTPWEPTDLTSQTIEEFHAKTCFSSQWISEVCLDSRRNLGAIIWWRCKK